MTDFVPIRKRLVELNATVDHFLISSEDKKDMSMIVDISRNDLLNYRSVTLFTVP